jgi:hypothetical protein
LRAGRTTLTKSTLSTILIHISIAVNIYPCILTTKMAETSIG